jgi:hypothetical protein
LELIKTAFSTGNPHYGHLLKPIKVAKPTGSSLSSTFLISRFRQEHHGFKASLIVPTRIRKIHFLCLGPIVVYREPKFDTLQEATILLFLFKDFNTLYKRVNKALLFCICEFTVYFIKASIPIERR